MNEMRILAALTLCWASSAEARELAPIGQSGNVFVERCGKSRPEPCRAYVSGLVDGLMVAGIASRTNLFCLPPAVTTSQVHDMLVAYILDNPEQRHLRTDELTYRSLAGSFPCPKRAPAKRK